MAHVASSPKTARGFLGYRGDRALSETPPTQQLSKKDKKRNMIQDRFSEIINSFSRDRDQHYRAQLHAIQTDMNLIMRAGPYGDSPLDDTGDNVVEQTNAVLGESSPIVPSAQSDYAAMAGRSYSRLVEEVNNAMEERDAQLTQIYNNYHNRLYGLERNNRFKIRVAQEEHRILANTVRERLIQSISQRRQRLLREKDQLDIGESNAFLLHPSQFSIANPASPGGAQTNRKTRHARHQMRDPDEPQSGPSVQEAQKRKRKALFDEDGSPGPSSRIADAAASSPYRDAKAKTTYSQYEAPAYSIDRLFTDKELALWNQTAGIAASQFFTKLKRQGPAARPGTTMDDDVGTADGGDASTNGTATATNGEVEAPSAAPEMDRAANASAHNHLTRSTRNNAASALADLANLAVSERPYRPSRPAFAIAPVVSLNGKDKAFAPPPPAVTALDTDNDLRWMSQPLKEGDEEATGQYEELLENVSTSTNEDIMLGMPFETSSAGAAGGTVNGLAELGNAAALVGLRAQNSLDLPGPANLPLPPVEAGGVPMSAQSSFGGVNDVGGVALYTMGEGSVAGGAHVKRTASGAGLLSTTDVVKRTRSRMA